MDNIIALKTDKFKNCVVSITIPLNLDEKVTDYNLIAAILKRGCMKYKSTKEIWSFLQDNYGSVFDIIISKKGEKLILNFYIQFLDNKYALFNEDLFRESVNFLKEIITAPLIENGLFNEEYFQQEKENLKILINSRIDDKDEYSIERSTEICCRGEAYEIYKYGTIERLNQIENKDLAALWKEILSQNHMIFTYCGDIEKQNFKSIINDCFGNLVNNIRYDDIISPDNKVNLNNKVKEETEKMKVNQGKLTLCYKTGVTVKDDSYFGMIVMNSILGGGTHSKLFNEVREKNSLAYYIYSFIEKFKGLMLITCGIDEANYGKAKDLIFEQIETIKRGEITEKEIEYSKRKLKNDLMSVMDSQYYYSDYVSTLRAFDAKITLEEIIKSIDKVSLKDIIEAANSLKLGSIFFIAGEEN